MPLPFDTEEIEYETMVFCRDLEQMTIATDHLFTSASEMIFGGHEVEVAGPEPDGYRYLGGGRFGSTST